MQQFQELPASLVASDIERVGLTTIALAQKSRPHVLPTDTTTLLDSVTRLSELVQGAIAFVDDVLVRHTLLLLCARSSRCRELHGLLPNYAACCPAVLAEGLRGCRPRRRPCTRSSYCQRAPCVGRPE